MKSAILFALFTTLGSAATAVSVSPASQTLPVGSPAQIQIAIAGLGLDSAPSLGAYDLNIAFNPAILSFTGLTFGDPTHGDQLNLSGAGTVSDFLILSPGVLEFFEISLDSPSVLDTQQLDHFVLATLQFSTLAPGTSALTPSLNSAGDSSGAPLTPSLAAGRINVSQTPEPGTMGLLALAIGIAIIAGFWSKGRKMIRMDSMRPVSISEAR